MRPVPQFVKTFMEEITDESHITPKAEKILQTVTAENRTALAFVFLQRRWKLQEALPEPLIDERVGNKQFQHQDKTKNLFSATSSARDTRKTLYGHKHSILHLLVLAAKFHNS